MSSMWDTTHARRMCKLAGLCDMAGCMTVRHTACITSLRRYYVTEGFMHAEPHLPTDVLPHRPFSVHGSVREG